MNSCFKAEKISDSVYWVGALDWGVKDFHGYATERGSSYNAYLIMAEKITLIDTVKAPFKDEMIQRIKSVTDDLENIDYIVSNHAEMDHSGSLSDIIKMVKPEKVFASKMGVKNLNAHFHDLDFNLTPVESGDSISLGNMNLAFVETKMLHWPDSMFSFIDKEKILFSQDGFGMHLADSNLFEDEISDDIIHWEAAKYFANILLLYSKKVLDLIDALPSLKLDIDIIAPDHGPVWRKNPMRIVQLYKKWAEQKPTKKVVIIYDTMWHSTEKMAFAIADGVKECGLEAKVVSMHSRDRSYAATELLDAGALICGSPTMNNNLFPTMADVLTYLKGLKPQNLIGAAFASFGWSGESLKQINSILTEIGVELVSEGVKVKYVPDEEALLECRQLGITVGKKLLERIS